ncbi:septum formation family protein [Paeniglutamicibacter sp. MACA_103]|uniref:septum formation family protein n=1 Tax=Paeniglutamicibacter sp. MACA_103 TaxID=3377337 RepID=UPI003894CFBA
MIRSTAAGAWLIIGFLALSSCSLIPAKEAPRDEAGTISKEVSADAFSIRLGDCLNDPGEGELDRVPVVPCEKPHSLEVFHEFTIDLEKFPDTVEAMDELTETSCMNAFSTFVGVAYDDSELDFTVMQPTKESWADGDKIVQCLIGDPSGATTTGSLKGSNA